MHLQFEKDKKIIASLCITFCTQHLFPTKKYDKQDQLFYICETQFYFLYTTCIYITLVRSAQALLNNKQLNQ